MEVKKGERGADGVPFAIVGAALAVAHHLKAEFRSKPGAWRPPRPEGNQNRKGEAR
jgi:hypothetical protein